MMFVLSSLLPISLCSPAPQVTAVANLVVMDIHPIWRYRGDGELYVNCVVFRDLRGEARYMGIDESGISPNIYFVNEKWCIRDEHLRNLYVGSCSSANTALPMISVRHLVECK